MKKILMKTKIKILLVVLISFFIVKYGSPQVFLANTPKLNKDNIIQLPSKMLASIASLNPFGKQNKSNVNDIFANTKPVNVPNSVVFKSISKGVYAGEDPKTGKSYLKIEAGAKYKITGTITINGKEYPRIEFVE